MKPFSPPHPCSFRVGHWSLWPCSRPWADERMAPLYSANSLSHLTMGPFQKPRNNGLNTQSPQEPTQILISKFYHFRDALVIQKQFSKFHRVPPFLSLIFKSQEFQSATWFSHRYMENLFQKSPKAILLPGEQGKPRPWVKFWLLWWVSSKFYC